MPRRLPHDHYTVGWVCALPIELAAAQEMLDDEHDRIQHRATIYTLGRIGEYNVVIAGLPEGQTGTVSAAVVAERMITAFASIRFGLMVGIGGGVPAEDADIRLGDVVVSRPYKAHGGVVQYDFGKATPSGWERTGALNTPPTILLNAIFNLQANHIRGHYKLPGYLSKLENLPIFARAGAGPDILFEAGYHHEKGTTCVNCTKNPVHREPRLQEIVVHYGTIASGNQVMRDGVQRDQVSAELGGVLCFEMEAAGLMNSFPCLVIRGICDYADSHKSKKWQPYAAGTAAACAKEVLSVIPLEDVMSANTVEEAMNVTNEYAIEFHDRSPHDQAFVAPRGTFPQSKLKVKGTSRSALIARSPEGGNDAGASSATSTNAKTSSVPVLSNQTLETLMEYLRMMNQQTDLPNPKASRSAGNQSPSSLESLERRPFALKLSNHKKRIILAPNDESTTAIVPRSANLTTASSVDTLARPRQLLNQDARNLFNTLLRGMTAEEIAEGFHRLREIVVKIGSLFKHNLSTLSAILAQAFIVMMAVMQSISLRGPLKLNIIFEDVLGRQHGLDFHYFRDWNTFRSMLEAQFRDCPGEEKVIKGEYQLMNSQRYCSVLSAENWAESVEPGMRVVMSILMERIRKIKGDCPRKDCQGVLELFGEQRSVCNTCKIEIRLRPETPRLVELTDHTDTGNIHSQLSQNHRAKMDNELQHFCRIYTDIIASPNQRSEVFAGNLPHGRMPPVASSDQRGNQVLHHHQLQDFQMQLMLLEQQNKRRLLMARQEQDSMAIPRGGYLPGFPAFSNPE